MMPVSSGAPAKNRAHVSQDKGSDESFTIRARKAGRRRPHGTHRQRSGEYHRFESNAAPRANDRSRDSRVASRFPSGRGSANGTRVQRAERSAAVSTAQRKRALDDQVAPVPLRSPKQCIVCVEMPLCSHIPTYRHSAYTFYLYVKL